MTMNVCCEVAGNAYIIQSTHKDIHWWVVCRHCALTLHIQRRDA